ncbi:ABC transporter ATP-binding protein [Desulfovibrio sp. UIB00]|uniref:ABC transporter ATP-binding protein n=1 Tax=Desulfovibrio sp. UIB00 TaxID=2804314 RepID=UPI001F0F735F|nr:ABC transporter ATP-binding protein [Desulfovibrio sp. UIB00]MCH5145397.1 ABC transporter ATP-binding protein [Desulfovibrio sp. UIB00]
MLKTLSKIFFLLPQLRQKQLIGLALAMVLVSFVELGLAGTISLLGVALADPASLEKIAVFKKIFQLVPNISREMPSSVRMLLFVMGMVCIATIAKNIITAVLTYWQNVVSQLIGSDVSSLLFEKYMYAPYFWHMQKNPGELSDYLNWRGQIAALFLGVLQVVSNFGVMFILMLGVFWVAPTVALLLYGVTACVAILVYKFSQNNAKNAGIQFVGLSTGVSRVIHAALHGIREVQIYHRRSAFIEKYSSALAMMARLSARQGTYPTLPTWCLECSGMLLLFLSIIVMVFNGENVAMITGTLTMMAAVSWRLLPAVNKIVGGILQVKTYYPTVIKILENYSDSNVTEKESDWLKTFSLIEIADVDFYYPDSKNAALKNLNLTIPKGCMIGVVGLSGAGKSTLVGILTGLLKPTSGKIIIDGTETAPLPGFIKIGYVPQHPYIMDASLAENVAFADWGGVPDEGRVIKCCQLAAIDFLDELPQGINTILGDRGVRLSGGQVQRVSVARALYNNPEILLFDEATSALDGAAESAIQKTIMTLSNDLTIIIIAHRLSTVEECDKLFWLKDGKVHRSGPARDVLAEYEAFLAEHTCGTDCIAGKV